MICIFKSVCPNTCCDQVCIIWNWMAQNSIVFFLQRYSAKTFVNTKWNSW